MPNSKLIPGEVYLYDFASHVKNLTIDYGLQPVLFLEKRTVLVAFAYSETFFIFLNLSGSPAWRGRKMQFQSDGLKWISPL